jgi:hypothetical protein
VRLPLTGGEMTRRKTRTYRGGVTEVERQN